MRFNPRHFTAADMLLIALGGCPRREGDGDLQKQNAAGHTVTIDLNMLDTGKAVTAIIDSLSKYVEEIKSEEGVTVLKGEITHDDILAIVSDRDKNRVRADLERNGNLDLFYENGKISNRPLDCE